MTSWTETLAALFASHRLRLESFVARRTRDPEAAADLTQEAFLRLARLKDAAKVDDPSKFLFTVAANLVHDHHRRSGRQPVIDADASGEDQPTQHPDAEHHLAARQDLAVLKSALATLPPKTRAVFVLYRAQGLSYRQIAERLDISPRTVEYHLRQALAHCRQTLRRAQGDIR